MSLKQIRKSILLPRERDGDYSAWCPCCYRHLYLKKTENCGQKPDDYALVPCSNLGCQVKVEPKSSCPSPDRPPEGTPIEPRTLVGRDVHGWGWKVFREKAGGGLQSEIYGKARNDNGPTLPENKWLDYREWGSFDLEPSYAFHILPSYEEAEGWIATADQRCIDRKALKIRKVGWRKKVDSSPRYVQDDFVGIIFTAEEIYILPEEGMPIEPAERPPEKGDWVVFAEGKYQTYRNEFPKPCRVVGYEGGWCRIQRSTGESGGFMPSGLRIVRRAADRLRVGDKVAFGSKEGWVFRIDTCVGDIRDTFCVNFTKYRTGPQPGDGWGAFYGKDLTLVEPHYEPKGDC